MIKTRCKLLKPFISPAIILALAVVLYFNWSGISKKTGNEIQALLVILPFLPYLFFSIGAIFGWRSNNAGLILNSFLLFLSYLGLQQLAASQPTMTLFVAFLLPLNLLIWGNIRNKYIFSKKGIRYLIIVLVEMILVYFLSYFHDQPQSKLVFEMQSEFPAFSANLASMMEYLLEFLTFKLLIGNILIHLFLLFSLSLLFYLYSYYNDSLYALYFVIIIVVFPAVMGYLDQAFLLLMFNAAGLILLVSLVEASFKLAYIDELTALPGRRSLMEAMANLGKTYTIAMIDIDYFKKFNDTYGHKTGDQVLQMVAAKLSQISGGAKTFRFGGEEFTAIFPGKTAQEALEFLEEFRKTIESSAFVVRGKKRRSDSEQSRGKGSVPADKQVTVTVSIGAVSSGKSLNKPEKVLKAADKVLYKAKHLGRNRVQIK